MEKRGCGQQSRGIIRTNPYRPANRVNPSTDVPHLRGVCALWFDRGFSIVHRNPPLRAGLQTLMRRQSAPALLASLVARGACLLAALWAMAAPPALAASSVVTTPQVRAELVAHAPEGLAPGKPVSLGLLIEHQPHWHTYWKNPGDSGLPTTLQWRLPPGLQAGDIQWPTPKKLPVGPLMNFGYEGRLLLAVPVTVSAPPAGEALRVQLKAEWLVCKDVCIPEAGEFALDVPVQAATAAQAELFAAARATLPQGAPGAQGQARVDGDSLVVEVSGLPPAWQGRPIDFLPETAGVILNAAAPQTRWDGGRWTARVPIDPQRSESPASMPVVLVTQGQPAGLALTLAVATPWPAAPPAPAPALGDAVVQPPAAAGGGVGFGLALLFALLGGVLLNLMPCVFPVLSLKVFGFAAHAHDRRGLLAGGLAYTAGVVLSFVALAGLLLALRAGGEQLGWGFQLQSPAFVAALAALFTLIGLNLAGVFEVGSVLPARWSAARARHPMVDSLLTGVLAVAVASPCTAPFMGASLGVAVTMPAAQALAVFAALGLGMAAPYLLASAWPALARILPRPGWCGCWASRPASMAWRRCWARCWLWPSWPGRWDRPPWARARAWGSVRPLRCWAWPCWPGRCRR
jgi:thiol:disulfide interchange protein DsbD